jgi:glucose-6-phosphate isomerase
MSGLPTRDKAEHGTGRPGAAGEEKAVAPAPGLGAAATGVPRTPMSDVTTVTAANVRITARASVRDAAQRVLGRLWIDKVPVRLASDDPTLWGLSPGAEPCWPAAPGITRALLPRFGELAGRARAAGLTEVVLVGQGAPAAAARVVARHAKAPLTVLDGLDPAPTLRLGTDPERLRHTVVVVAGADDVSAAHAGILRRLLRDLGLSHDELAERFVMVSDHLPAQPPGHEPAPEPDPEPGQEPGQVPARAAAAPGGSGSGDTALTAPRGGVFGALSPYALLAAALAGVDVPEILDQATAVLPSLTRPENNPGLVLGAILGGCARQGRDKVVIAGFGARYPGLDEWAGMLLAGATSRPRAGARFGGGVVPVVQGGGLPLSPAGGLFLVALDGRPHQDDATVTGPLGAQFVVWEYAAAVAAYLLGADPFAVPAGAGRPPGHAERAGEPVFRDRDIDGYPDDRAGGPGARGPENVTELLDHLLGAIPEHGHLAILSYLDPDPFLGQGRAVRRLAAALAARGGRPVTVSWDPAGLASGAGAGPGIGQGVYLVLTGNVMDDKPVLDEGDRLSRLQLAQALRAARALRDRGRPVARVHLHHRWTGIAQLLDAAHQGGRA